MKIIYCILSLVELSFIFAYDDLSYNKVATQSHTFTGTSYLYDASNAVDGNAATCMRTKEIGSRSPDKTVWWKVDLGEVYNIYIINILFRKYDGYDLRQRRRFAGFSLYVSNTGVIQGSTLCYKDGSQLPPLNFTATCKMYGRYVIFYNERLDGMTYPIEYQTNYVVTELCEVIVLGCKMPGMYGSFCNKTCPNNCKDAVCHVQNGDCYNCKPGWTGKTCSNASQQHAETDNNGISCTPWIIAFSVALVIIIILSIATIKLWRRSIKGNSNDGSIQSSKIPASGETQVGLSDGVSHYQELSVSKEHNTYQILTI